MTSVHLDEMKIFVEIIDNPWSFVNVYYYVLCKTPPFQTSILQYPKEFLAPFRKIKWRKSKERITHNNSAFALHTFLWGCFIQSIAHRNKSIFNLLGDAYIDGWLQNCPEAKLLNLHPVASQFPVISYSILEKHF